MTDDLYHFIFNMVESDRQFSVNSNRSSKPGLSKAMLAKPFKGILPASFACEPKIDGVRVIVEVCRQTLAVAFTTRNGNPLSAIQHLGGWFAETASSHGVYTFDCEAVSGTDFFDGVGNLRSQERDDKAELWLLDIPDAVGTYAERREVMSRMVLDTYITLVPSFFNLAPNDAFRRFVAQGFEGAMVKDTSAPYQHGKRSNAWLKVKAVDSEDCAIVSVHEGKGRLAGVMGHVVVEHGNRLIRVGNGFTDEQRRIIWENRDTIIGQWLEVSFQSVTPEGSFRHPRIRGDK